MSETEIQEVQKSLTLILKKLELAEKERNDLKEENKVMKESSEKLTEKYLEIEGKLFFEKFYLKREAFFDDLCNLALYEINIINFKKSSKPLQNFQI